MQLYRKPTPLVTYSDLNFNSSVMEDEPFFDLHQLCDIHVQLFI